MLKEKTLQNYNFNKVFPSWPHLKLWMNENALQNCNLQFALFWHFSFLLRKLAKTLSAEERFIKKLLLSEEAKKEFHFAQETPSSVNVLC